MEFYTVAKEKRPVRLSDETRRFAYESIYEFKYGKDAEANDAIEVHGTGNLSDIERFDMFVRAIAEESPIRICENEKVSGAANLGAALRNVIPAKDEKGFIVATNHLTLDFFPILKIGYTGLLEKIEKYKKDTDFYRSLENTIESFDIWCNRYANTLKDMKGYEDNYRNLCHVPKYGATNFYEAVQSLWITFAFTRLTGNWPGIGRIDVMLGDYLKKDLENGTETIDSAREILAHFFIKGCEWITGKSAGSGDAQYYQNIVLSGIDRNGKDVTNEVTYLILDIVEELGISDFPITVRLNKNSDPYLLKRVAEVMRYGGGVIAVYNEDLILESLKEYGYPAEEVNDFANDGCWEVQIPGKTRFAYAPFDALQILQKDVFESYEKKDFSSYKEIYDLFIEKLDCTIGKMAKDYDDWNINVNNSFPCSVVSLFEGDCIERGASYVQGGAVYTVISPHIGGVADITNSLYAIKKLVFDEKKISLPEFFDILKNNWQDDEALRQYVKTRYRYYGNDNDESDSIAVDILNDFAAICKKHDHCRDCIIPPGVSTFGRQIEWRNDRLATPFGTLKGDILAGNASPTPGTDFSGATSIIKSYCKADLKKMVTGTALDIHLLAKSCSGEEGLQALISLLKGFVTLGGYFMQIDVADSAILKEARLHPERYQSLSVRVSGWNARFATLDKDWQDMIIGRME